MSLIYQTPSLSGEADKVEIIQKRSPSGPPAPLWEAPSLPIQESIARESTGYRQELHDTSLHESHHASVPFDEEGMLREVSGYSTEDFQFREPEEQPIGTVKAKDKAEQKKSRKSRKLQQMGSMGEGSSGTGDASGQGFETAPSSDSSWPMSKVVIVSAGIGVCGMGLATAAVCACMKCRNARSRSRKRDLSQLEEIEPLLIKRSSVPSYLDESSSNSALHDQDVTRPFKSDAPKIPSSFIKRSNHLPANFADFSHSGIAQQPELTPLPYESGTSNNVLNRRPSLQDASPEYLQAIGLQPEKYHEADEGEVYHDAMTPSQIAKSSSGRKTRRNRKLQQMPDLSTGGSFGGSTSSTPTVDPYGESQRHDSAAEGFNNTFDPSKGGGPNPFALAGGIVGGVVASAGAIVCVHNIRTGKCKMCGLCKRSLSKRCSDSGNTKEAKS